MARQTRREFLEQSFLAATAAAMAGSSPFLPAQAEEQSSSPSERLRIAVLGVNGRGKAHVGGFSHRSDTEVAVICDPDTVVGQSMCDRIEKETKKRPAYVADLRDVFNNRSIDAVSIATPNHWHALAAIWAIQSEKDVYVEKPVSHNVSEGRRIVDAARKYNRICQTGTQSRSMTGTRELMKFIHEGGIGTVSLARALCYKRRPSIGPRGTYEVPASVNYDLWSGPAPMKPLTRKQFHYDWHWQWDYGNGDLGNQGIHQMDLARWGLGVSDIGQGVLSYGGRLGYEDAGDTANTQVSIHDYGDKTLVFEVRGLETPPYMGAGVGVIFYGSNGYAVMSSYAGGVVFDPDGNKLREFKGGDDGLHYANFVKAVRSRRVDDLNADIEQGHLSSALCHLGNVSYRLGDMMPIGEVEQRLAGARLKDECLATLGRVKEHLSANNVDLGSARLQFGALLGIDGKAETFTGEWREKANPFLSREYRKGYEVPSSAGTV
jgi:predicted dehydrogenase